MTRKARLDANRTARPMTAIVTHARVGRIIGPGLYENLEVRDLVCKDHDDCKDCRELARECQVGEPAPKTEAE